MGSSKVIAGLALLLLLYCVIPNDGMPVASSNEPRLPDQHVIKLVEKFRAQIQEMEGEEFLWFTPVSFKKQILQIVPGTNYKIKVRYDNGYMILTVLNPLPFSQEEPYLMAYEKHVALYETSIHFPSKRINAPLEKESDISMATIWLWLICFNLLLQIKSFAVFPNGCDYRIILIFQSK